jgi:hypothetical protein
MNTQTSSVSPDIYSILHQTSALRVSDGKIQSLLEGCSNTSQLLVLIWSQLGDFDSLEYAGWMQREKEHLTAKNITIRAVGIGDRHSGIQFCNYTGFSQEELFVDSEAKIHTVLGLYRGLNINFPLLSTSQKAWLNLMLMCAGIGSPGTLKEVFRGYTGDKKAPQLIADEEVIKGTPLPPMKGSFFKAVGGSCFQRPFELATLRLRNMTEVLSHWQTYVPDSSYLTQRGGTFLFDSQRQLIYEHRDRGILGFADNMSNPLSFLLDSTQPD